jgi:hypothetical protein
MPLQVHVPTARTKRQGADRIVYATVPPVKSEADKSALEQKRGRPGRPQSRRQSHGSVWHCKQTDTWYYTLPGTKKRFSLFEEDGNKTLFPDSLSFGEHRFLEEKSMHNCLPTRCLCVVCQLSSSSVLHFRCTKSYRTE